MGSAALQRAKKQAKAAMVVRHEWKRGSRVAGDAEAAHKQFEDLLRQNGGATPTDIPLEAVIEANRPDDAPLHLNFEYDDLIAGHLFRLQQAGHVVRSLHEVVVDLTTEEEQAPRRMYVPKGLVQAASPTQDDERTPYVYQRVVYTEEPGDQAARLRASTFDRIKRLVAELRHYTMLADIVGDLDDLILKYGA